MDRDPPVAALLERIGRVGLWSFAFDSLPAAPAREMAAEIEALGFRALWIPEGVGSKEIFSHASLLLSATSTLVVSSGIASIWARDPVAMANGARTLADAYPNRFVLGLGVSHRTSVERRGAHRYERPYSRMRAYLDAMDEARYGMAEVVEPPRMLAALGRKMLGLAAKRALGAHPYFVPTSHTPFAREALGPAPLLAPEQACVLERDAIEARRIARRHMSYYLKLENYVRNLRRLGFDDDVSGEGSDRLVDAIVAWGDVDAIRRRVHEHLDGGADHVCVQVLSADSRAFPIAELRELASALL